MYGVVRNCLMGRRSPDEQMRLLSEYLGGHQTFDGDVICVLSHSKNRDQRREMVENHDGTSFETRKFLCIFTDPRLPKQHFKL
jgi:hypothetical protein